MMEHKPLTLYACFTAMTEKVVIMMEECELLYILRPVDIKAQEHLSPEFMRINPTGRLPAMTCHDCVECGCTDMNIFGSAAIILSLSDMTGLFQPSDLHGRCAALQWFCWQSSELGPALRHVMDLRRQDADLPAAAIEKATREARRLYAVLDHQLARQQYMSGQEYSLADIGLFPWVRRAARQGIDLDEFANVRRWAGEVAARPHVQTAITALRTMRESRAADSASRKQA